MKKLIIFTLIFNCFSVYSQTDKICNFVKSLIINDSTMSSFMNRFESNGITTPIDSALIYVFVNESVWKEFNIKSSDFKPTWDKLLAECNEYRIIYNGFKQIKENSSKPVERSDEEYYNSLIHENDSVNILEWSDTEKLITRYDCYGNMLKKVQNYNEICECATEKLSKIMNYSKFKTLSDYQRGKIIGLIMRFECSDIKVISK